MNISAVNLNDAVHLLLNRKFEWLGLPVYSNVVTIANFNKTNCPLLHTFDRKSVVTYKDWIAILAGNSSITTTLGKPDSRCLALSDYEPWSFHKPWGRTFGKHKGPNGKPLAEVMPLDEMFWFYDAFDRQLRGTINRPSTPNPSLVVSYYYNTEAWQWYWSEDKGFISPDMHYHDLQPGVYGACNMSYGRDTGFDILDETGTNQGLLPFIRVFKPSGSWGFQNSIFFVDSPVKVRPWWAGGNHFQGVVFRITPPGYWVL